MKIKTLEIKSTLKKTQANTIKPCLPAHSLTPFHLKNKRENLFSSVHDWGAAPEVYKYPAAYTPKSDIWLVGICALEMAYGGLHFHDRDELLRLISWVRVEKRLPNRGEEGVVRPVIVDDQEMNIIKIFRKKMTRLKILAYKFICFRYIFMKLQGKGYLIKEYDEENDKKEKGVVVVKCLEEKAYKILIPRILLSKMRFMKKKKTMKKDKNKIGSFSKEFGQMVADCLAEDPGLRPDILGLLHYNFFKNSRSVAYFEDVVMKEEIDPVWVTDGA